MTSQPYTAVSDSALVSMNPLTSLPVNSDAALHDYIKEYFQSAGDDVVGQPGGKEALGPHIFRTSLNAYYNMRRTGQDQIILMRWVCDRPGVKVGEAWESACPLVVTLDRTGFGAG